MAVFLLLNVWFRHGGLSDPIDSPQPKPDPDESESVDAWPEEPELELF